MYTVTFYSFKGGVGRTMALVNVAVELVLRGKKVLVVDFDLEAPGLTTFDLFDKAYSTYGLVDYISRYMHSSAAPDVSEYIEECTSNIQNAEGKLWIMSAGLKNAAYPCKLNEINWLDLYEQRDGYLLFEDMKKQWKAKLNPDYVLIDSRTGHTDTGGICTRQLPDAVALMFFPNKQNIEGLISVVDNVHREEGPPRGKEIKMHFVLSNVPDLDDEHGILQGLVEHAKQELKFTEVAATIHHYNSLSLLNQMIFTQTRPRSKLTQEYKTLTRSIVSGNILDRDGALATIKDVQQLLLRPARKNKTFEVFEKAERQLTSITDAHNDDPEILQRVAAVHERLGSFDKAIALLNASLSLGRSTAELYLRRASLYHIQGSPENASKDLISALSSKDSSLTAVLRAVRGLKSINPESLAGIENYNAFQSLENYDKVNIARVIMEENASPKAAQSAQNLLRKIVEDPILDNEIRSMALVELSLGLMRDGRFADVKLMLDAPPGDRYHYIRDCFNYAMADWGVNQKPSRELFVRVLELHQAQEKQSRKSDANYCQCLAIASNITGEPSHAKAWIVSSRKLLSAAPMKQYSAWRYRDVSSNEFEEDLNEIIRWINGESVEPRFLKNKNIGTQMTLLDRGESLS